MREEKKKILKNLSYLSVLQVGNYVIPFLLIPYLIKVLGVEYFGLVSFMQAIMINLSVVTDYGFNISTISHVSLNRDNKPFLRKLYSEVFFTKLLLFVPCLLVLALFILFVPKCSVHPYVTLVSFMIVIGNTLLPIWLFQGMEQMKFTTIFTLTSKLIFALLTVFFVHKPQDFFWVMILQGVGGLLATLAAIYFIKVKWGIGVNIATGINGIKKQLKESWHYFISNASIALYTNTSVIVLGLFAPDKIVGLYSIAEKIMQTIRVLLSVYIQAVYAHVCLLIYQGKENIILFFKKMYLPFLIAIVFLSVLIFSLAPFIASLLTRENKNELVTYIRILIFVPPIVCMNIPFNLIILAKNWKNEYARILLFAAILLLFTSLSSTYYFGALGTCISMLFVEVVATALLCRLVYNKNVNAFKINNVLNQKQ
jgi:PST family polysaccharide transporter